MRHLQDRPASTHARRLLAWLQINVPRATIITHDIISEQYAEMLIELGWNERPWQTVAHQFTAITSGRKVYQNLWRNGRKHRLRVYPIPAATDSSVTSPILEPTHPLEREAA